ncbi:tail fiber protein [Neptunomonas qingdaonensis]|uniref:Microcystin-dependent protein n=1 Tax=Neptunomonas qingdaonensis TaxID=1045558 RepID=A0A1I2RA69_9GAMM|nr:tail fiber protein [Neptunomonas qingdaonensis]SFG37360.1 Microcystin-dependent protein [Neptunomonas qingdaonensis]
MALSDDDKKDIQEYLHKYLRVKVIALFGLIGLGTIVAILTAGWNAAEKAAEAIAENPSRIADELSKIPEFSDVIAMKATGVPVGSIMPFGGEITTDVRNKLHELGWLPCTGEPVSRNEFKELFSVIGTAWGAPGSLSYNLPDLRGRFIRGVDGNSGQDLESTKRVSSNKGGNSGNMVGSYQNESTRMPTNSWDISDGSHTHTTNGKPWIAGASKEGSFPSGTEHPLSTPSITGGSHGHSINGGDAETRPKNVYVNWLIRFKGPTVQSN